MVTESVQPLCVVTRSHGGDGWAGGHGGSAEPPPSMYMYKVLFVCSFLWLEKTAKKEACRLRVLLVVVDNRSVC